MTSAPVRLVLPAALSADAGGSRELVRDSRPDLTAAGLLDRSEERRVGKECPV